jgi:hypothetical protein
MAFLRGERQVCAMVRPPTREAEDPSPCPSIRLRRTEPHMGCLSVKHACCFSRSPSDPRFEPISFMRPKPPHHLTFGRTSSGPDHNPACLRGRARRGGTHLGSAACFSPGSARPPPPRIRRLSARLIRRLGRAEPIRPPSTQRRLAPGPA